MWMVLSVNGELELILQSENSEHEVFTDSVLFPNTKIVNIL